MKNSLRLKALTIFAVLCFGMGSANASSLYGPSFSHNGANWDAIFGDNNVTGVFNDIFPFYLPVGAGGDGGGSVISGFAQTGPDVYITRFTLFDITTNSIIDTGTLTPGIFKSISFPGPLNPTDHYALVVKGGLLPAGHGSGSFAGNFHISPIPEPETYAMLLAGLGLLGFMARRSKESIV